MNKTTKWIMYSLLILAIGGAGYYFFIKKDEGGADEGEKGGNPDVEPGEGR